MDFFTDLMGLILLIACIAIVLIFLKDYTQTGKAAVMVNKKQKRIVYEIYHKDELLKSGAILDSQLPFQFGRKAGSGNDAAIVTEAVSEEEAGSVSRAWFFIQQDTVGNYVLYSADESAGDQKKISGQKKLIVPVKGSWRAVHTVKLQPGLQVKADRFKVTLNVENPEDAA